MNQPEIRPAVFTLTKEEGEALLSLIDEAVKSRGLEVAANAAVLHQKINKAFVDAQAIPKE